MNNPAELIQKEDQERVQILSRNLRALLDIRSISEYEIAQAIDIPVMTVRRIVSGETEDPRISNLKLIADYLNISIDFLLQEDCSKPLNHIGKKIPRFVPILDWKLLELNTCPEAIDFSSWEKWCPVILSDDMALSNKSFAIESRPSMQPRFPKGTLFIIDPNEAPSDGDMVLIQIQKEGDLSLRELIVDPPKWQLSPVVAGSEVIFYDDQKHFIVGVVVLSMLHTKKDK